MEAFALTLFFASFVGILGLFTLKMWEERRGATVAPHLRAQADESARELKVLIGNGQTEMKKVAPTALRMSRVVLHELALSLAALSRASERQAHKLADMVSHKRHFERREPKNEFLTKVGTVKNSRSKSAKGAEVEVQE